MGHFQGWVHFLKIMDLTITRLDHVISLCKFINVNVNEIWYWCEFSQWLSYVRWACITWQMCHPRDQHQVSETERSGLVTGHGGQVTTCLPRHYLLSVLPNTQQFLTISKVILSASWWPAGPAAGRCQAQVGGKLWKQAGHIRNARRVLPGPGTRTPGGWIWDAYDKYDFHLNIGCDAVYRVGPGYRSSSFNI